MSEGERWPRIESLLDQALEIPPKDRRSFLERRCPDDPELAAEVLELLAAAEASGPLDRPISEIAEAALQPPGGLGAGQRVGAWRLVEPLASGGMGRVFVARREDGDFEQRAAVKLLRWELATPELVERFRLERQILAELDHPGIARLIDGGVTEDGLPFLAMELVEGRAIDLYCQEENLTLEQRLALFLDVCEAVRAAHGRLVIHRDLKPSNILVTGEGQVRLLDFGIGKLLQPSAGGAVSLTQDRLAPATPAYAAPEQLEGKAMSVATDVYGLGIVLYELLTGFCPFAAGGSSPLDVARRVLETEPAPPSRSPGERPPVEPRSLRGDLDNIVLAALRKEPERRYGSVEALAADLRRYLAGRPVSATPATAAYRARKFIRRHRIPTALTALLLAGAIAATVAIAQQSRNARQQAARAQATADFLERTLIDANLQENTAGDDSVSSLLDRAEPRVDVELAEFPGVRAQVRLLLARAFQGVGRLEDSRRLHRLALEEAEAHHGLGSVEVGWALVGLANTDTAEGSAERLDLLSRALEIMETHHGRRSRQAMEVINLIGHTHVRAGQLEAGEAAFRETLDIATEVLGPDDLWAATALGNLGSAERQLERYDASVEHLRRALGIFVRRESEGVYAALAMRNNLALALVESGRFDEAELEYRRTIELREQKLGKGHPSLGQTLTNLGRLLMDQGRFIEAEAPIRRAAAVLRSTMPESDFSRIASEINLATLSLELDEVGAAHRLYSAAHLAFTGQLGEAHAATLRAGWLLGEAERRRGRFAAAQALLERLPDPSRPINGARHADRLLSLGRMALDRGRPAEAAARLDEALALYRQHLEKEDDLRLLETRAERLVADVEPSADGGEELRSLYDRLADRLPPGNWRLGRLEAFLGRSTS